jgi:hypothetical protein
MPAETAGPLGSIDTTYLASAVLPALGFLTLLRLGGPPRSHAGSCPGFVPGDDR